MKQPDCSCRPQSDYRPCDCGGFTCRPTGPEDRRPSCCCGHPSNCNCPLCRPRPQPPCPPHECQCCDCRQDCSCHGNRKPFPPHGFLLPKVIASGREWLRRRSFCLRIEGVSECAQPPFTLLSVTACGEPTWESLPCDNRRQQLLRVTVPVACQVRDCGGCAYTGHASICVDVCVNLTTPAGECWRNNLMILPCVRLVCVPCASDDLCFEAQLEVLLEVYMIRWEPCMVGVPKPVCPDLPLYPQPRIE